MKKLAIGMQKGGVGKSTTTINLAGALAERGNDVLLVDADPQGFSTVTLGHRDYYVDPDATTMYEIMRKDPDEFDLVNEIIRDHAEMDIVPSHGRMFNLEKELYSMSRTQERLGMVLDHVEYDYDYLLIDSPPNLGPLADGSLLAAENVLFVSKADVVATFSLNLLLGEIESLESNYGTTISTVGAVANEVDRNGIADARLDWFRENIGNDNLFVVPDSVAIEGAFEQNATIFSAAQANNHREQKADELSAIYRELGEHVGVSL